MIRNAAKDTMMPWTTARYPRSMGRLPDGVRRKAIAIANALLEDGYEEGRAIRIAIAQAKRWAAARGAQAERRRTLRKPVLRSGVIP